MARTDTTCHLDWRETEVSGRTALYGVAGDGPPVLFLHGWGLGHRSYRRALKRLVQGGARVYAPAMPGFGGSAELPRNDFSLAGYAKWVHEFVVAVGITQPVTLIGHSFGGGVAIRTAHDYPELARHLVLVNSIGGSVWANRKKGVRTMRERPLWDWGLHLPADTFSVRTFTTVVPVIAADAVPNVVRQPRTLWKVGHLARSADLTVELAELRSRQLPVTILWGKGDTVIPWACLESMRAALGEPALITVDGNHSWLLAQPDRFAELITNIAMSRARDPQVA